MHPLNKAQNSREGTKNPRDIGTMAITLNNI